MIGKQIMKTYKKIDLKEYVMENMFCMPKGPLGRLGGQLMSQNRRLLVWVLDLLEINPSDSVLEVGSGPGVGLELAAARAHDGRVVGIDPSETMFEMASLRNHTQIEAGRIELQHGSVDKLPFEDATFNKAMTMNSLHLWPDPVVGPKEISVPSRKVDVSLLPSLASHTPQWTSSKAS